MTEYSLPSPTHNSRAVDDIEVEQLVEHVQPDGLVGVPTDDPLIYADGVGTREVRVRASRLGMVRGRLWGNDASVVTKTLAANSSGSTRIDLIVLRLSRTTYAVTVEVVQGTPGAGAPAATRNTGTTGVWEMELAEVTVADGATTLAAGTVTSRAWYLGEDGQILCTSTTRPPHNAGRRILQSGVEYVSDGTNWVLTREDTGWLSLSAASGWAANSSGMRYRRKNGFVTVKIAVNRTGSSLPAGASNDSTLTTIPSGSRPSEEVPIAGYINGAYLAHGVINSNGTVVLTDYFQNGVGNGQTVRFAAVTYPV